MYGISAQQSIPLHVSVIIQVIGPSISGSFNILNGHSEKIFAYNQLQILKHLQRSDNKLRPLNYLELQSNLSIVTIGGNSGKKSCIRQGVYIQSGQCKLPVYSIIYF